jgi:type II secretion system protein H
MKSEPNRGFTLIELMVVVTIIGICSAIVVPRLVEHKRTSDLTDVVNMVQQTVAQARTLALQTRRAAVVDVRGTSRAISVKTLAGAKCTDATAQSGMASFSYSADPYQTSNSKAVLCGATITKVSGTSCAAPAVVVGSDFFLCYSGTGDLYFSADSGATWTRACLRTDTGATGAVLRFNRFTGASPANCAASPLDVTRAVMVPSGGAPYSRVDIL